MAYKKRTWWDEHLADVIWIVICVIIIGGMLIWIGSERAECEDKGGVYVQYKCVEPLHEEPR
jgi:hypothetical protein